MKYAPTIGLEIHAELKTQTKMFCDSKNDPDEKRANVNICPVCMGHPGTLPVINKEAVKHVLKIGTAVRGALADFTRFDRKNYFYPDIPKGYQISQYQFPLVSGGVLADVELERVHLEEDTGRSGHETGDFSLVDFNRAGIPLMELVTKPVIKSAEEASYFAKELQLLLRYLGASDANMEKGEMRVEANISLFPLSADTRGQDVEGRRNLLRNSASSLRESAISTLGTKVEIKNLNSFKAVEKAIEYEISRQAEVLEEGKKVIQETRGWDENKGKTFSQRIKESSNDYRYFPEPDLPHLRVSEIAEFSREKLTEEMPELPWEKRKRIQDTFSLAAPSVEMLVSDRMLGAFFDGTADILKNDKDSVKILANYLTSDLASLINASGIREWHKNIDSNRFAELITMIKNELISSRGAKDILAKMFNGDTRSPSEIAEKDGLLQKNDDKELQKMVAEVIAENSKVFDEYKGGKETALQYLIGQVMKKSKGSANPKTVSEIIVTLKN